MRKSNFTFEISLSVLDHLGRNLYRSFATVLGEAISNAWDADANNVRIYIDKESNSFVIKDDGTGMTADDFQNKFLKIGYSKRKTSGNLSGKKRPYIGRKGIGKLALLSCAHRITIISKVAGGQYVGGVIDNSGLDKAITDDLTPKQYKLAPYDLQALAAYTKDHSYGTIIRFEGIKEGIKNSLEHLRKLIALYFRFSLLDKGFSIYVDDVKVTLDDLNDLAANTQFVWNLNGLKDPYLSKLKNMKEMPIAKAMENGNKGFIASVYRPSDLSIRTTGERVGVDLFVNGRLREHDILKHIPTARIAENYFYGQIHFNELDDDSDRFTSSREGIVADDPKYAIFLELFRKQILEIVGEWDDLRRKHRKPGDPENKKISEKTRKSEELFNAVSEEFSPPANAPTKSIVDTWLDELGADAAFNIASYAECFISENLVRKYIEEKKLPLTPVAQRDMADFKKQDAKAKRDGNINIEIRQNPRELGFLDMTGLSHQVERPGPNSIQNDAKEFRPIRNAVAHTALLTDEAKLKLTSVFNNIKARVKALLSKP